MPAYLPSPGPDPLPFPEDDSPVADSDPPMVGYECAMPWFHVAALAAAPASAPWPGSLAG